MCKYLRFCRQYFVDEDLWARFRGQRFATAKIWRYNDLRIQKIADTKKRKAINVDM